MLVTETESFQTEFAIELNFIQVFCFRCKTVNTVDIIQPDKSYDCYKCDESSDLPVQRFAPSIVISDFVLQEPIGFGAAGTVFRAQQISTNRLCAVKVLHKRSYLEEQYLHEQMQKGSGSDKLKHPNTLQCLAIGNEDGNYYYAMEYIEGYSLTKTFSNAWPLKPQLSVNIVLQVIFSLENAWTKEQLIHLDISPDNIILDSNNHVKLADMGLALSTYAIHSVDDNDIIGNPQYISPEQIMGQSKDFRSDIYSLGVVFYQLLTGRPAFNGNTIDELCHMQIEDIPDCPSRHNKINLRALRVVCPMWERWRQ